LIDVLSFMIIASSDLAAASHRAIAKRFGKMIADCACAHRKHLADGNKIATTSGLQ
jgi:hypothetical protein